MNNDNSNFFFFEFIHRYYGSENSITTNDDSSCQSLSNVPDSSSIVQNTKSLALQSNAILMTGSSNVTSGGVESSISNESTSLTNVVALNAEEKLVKRIRFKGSLVNNEQQQQEQEDGQKLLDDNNQRIDQQNQSHSLSTDQGDPLEQK